MASRPKELQASDAQLYRVKGKSCADGNDSARDRYRRFGFRLRRPRPCAAVVASRAACADKRARNDRGGDRVGRTAAGDRPRNARRVELYAIRDAEVGTRHFGRAVFAARRGARGLWPRDKGWTRRAARRTQTGLREGLGPGSPPDRATSPSARLSSARNSSINTSSPSSRKPTPRSKPWRPRAPPRRRSNRQNS